MEMKYQPVTEEDLIAFVSESIDPFEPDPPAAASSASSGAEDDEDESWQYDYVSEDDIARENGFWIDDDGHWQELDDDCYGW